MKVINSTGKKKQTLNECLLHNGLILVTLSLSHLMSYPKVLPKSVEGEVMMAMRTSFFKNRGSVMSRWYTPRRKRRDYSEQRKSNREASQGQRMGQPGQGVTEAIILIPLS